MQTTYQIIDEQSPLFKTIFEGEYVGEKIIRVSAPKHIAGMTISSDRVKHINHKEKARYVNRR